MNEENFDEALLIKQRVDPSYDEPILHQVLRIAVYDEFHAYETYRKIIDTFGSVAPFSNIIQAEIRHYQALTPLLQKYGVAMPFDNWYEKIEVPSTILECCEVGVGAEIQNIQMYDDLLMYVEEYPDVQDVLFRLQAASYNNHLKAFRECVISYSNEAKSVNSFAGQTNVQDSQMLNKVNDFRTLASKFTSGNVSEQDITKLLGSVDIATIGGVLLGGMGAMQLVKMINEDKGE
ncbi:MAG: hypothetical protein WC982_11755 [Advenella sp.]